MTRRWWIAAVLVLAGCVDIPVRGTVVDAESETDRAPPDGGGPPPDMAVLDADPADAAPPDGNMGDDIVDAAADAAIEMDLAIELDAELDMELDAELDMERDAEPDMAVDAELDMEPDAAVSPLDFGGCLPLADDRDGQQAPCLRMAVATPIPVRRTSATMVPLFAGRVAVVGGLEPTPAGGAARDSTWIYDPAVDLWVEGPALAEGRWQAPIVEYDRGLAIVGGGGDTSPLYAGIDTVETWVPGENAWAAAGTNIAQRAQHTAAVADDRILAIGGRVASDRVPLRSVVAWNPDPRAGVSEHQPMRDGRAGHVQAVSGDLIIVAGGFDADGAAVPSLEYRGMQPQAWSQLDDADVARVAAAARVLPSGDVLIVGGRGGNFGHPEFSRRYASTVRFRTEQRALAGDGTMMQARADFTLDPIGDEDGWLLAVGGVSVEPDGVEPPAVVEVYDPVLRRWWPFLLPDGADALRSFHGAVTNDDGLVIVSGGTQGGAGVPADEVVLDQTLIFDLERPEPVDPDPVDPLD